MSLLEFIVVWLLVWAVSGIGMVGVLSWFVILIGWIVEENMGSICLCRDTAHLFWNVLPGEYGIYPYQNHTLSLNRLLIVNPPLRSDWPKYSS
jgi:hypothetical protein